MCLSQERIICHFVAHTKSHIYIYIFSVEIYLNKQKVYVHLVLLTKSHRVRSNLCVEFSSFIKHLQNSIRDLALFTSMFSSIVGM